MLIFTENCKFTIYYEQSDRSLASFQLMKKVRIMTTVLCSDILTSLKMTLHHHNIELMVK